MVFHEGWMKDAGFEEVKEVFFWPLGSWTPCEKATAFLIGIKNDGMLTTGCGTDERSGSMKSIAVVGIGLWRW